MVLVEDADEVASSAVVPVEDVVSPPDSVPVPTASPPLVESEPVASASPPVLESSAEATSVASV